MRKNYWNGSLWRHRKDLCKRSSRFIINKNFIYIQIPKTGSSSILEICDWNGLTRHKRGYKHEGYHFLTKFARKRKKEFITTVRNPYCQILSYFFYHLMKEKLLYDESFDKVYDYFKIWLERNITNKHIKQVEYLKINGKLDGNITILKYEDKNTLKYLNKRFKLKFKDKKVNVSKHPIYVKENYKKFFKDTEIVDLIKTNLHEEFEVLGYSKDLESAF